MKRRTSALVVALAGLIAVIVASTLPASASRTHAPDPASIDPSRLALPLTILPSGYTVDHNAVSPNSDADNTALPPDGTALRQAHPTSYTSLGRLTGYRLDIRFTLQGASAGTEYLASIFPSQAAAQAALSDLLSLIRIIGTPLTGDQCGASGQPPEGAQCLLEGPVPGSSNRAVLGAFFRGPILIETATQVPSEGFNASVHAALIALLSSILNTADSEAGSILNGSQGATPTSTAAVSTPTATAIPTATATLVVPTATATIGKKACPKNSKKKHGKCACKKGYTKKHGKCVKKKKHH